MVRTVCSAGLVLVLLVTQPTSGAEPENRFAFRHHSIDMDLPVYETDKGWLVGDYGGAGLAVRRASEPVAPSHHPPSAATGSEARRT